MMFAALEFTETRRRLGISLKELSRRTGLSIQWLKAVEAGDAVCLPDMIHLRQDLSVLALALGLDPDRASSRYIAELPGRSAWDEFESETLEPETFESETSTAPTSDTIPVADSEDAFVSGIAAPRTARWWQPVYEASLAVAVIGVATAIWFSAAWQRAIQFPMSRRAGVSAVGPADLSADENLSGLWTLTSYVERSNVTAFNDLALGFRLRLDQDGNRIRGDGFKWSENGRRVSARGRTPIRVEGTIEGDRLALKVTERGTRRVSHGNLTMQRVGHGLLSGHFSTDAGQSTGRAAAVRISSQH